MEVRILDESTRHDSAAITEQIAQGLERVMAICAKRGEKPPSKLIVCGDNTVRELKNRYCMQYLMNLVARRKVRLAGMYFLRKSHTHDKIDQLFGIIARRISNTDQMLNASESSQCVEEWCAFFVCGEVHDAGFNLHVAFGYL